MKCFLVLNLILSSLLSVSARAASITACQVKQLAAVHLAMDGDADINRVFEGGFSSINFSFDDAWEQPTIRVAASTLPGSAACSILYRLEINGPEVLGCLDYVAIEESMSCPDRCKSCGLELGRP